MNTFYRDESSNPKWNAQRNLHGRTHYVDDDTLRFHHSRILSTHIAGDGLLFALVESCAKDMNNTRRGFRAVVFDIFGTVINRPNSWLEDMRDSRKMAEVDLYKVLSDLNAKTITLEAIKRAEAYHAMEMADLRAKVTALRTPKAA